MAVPLLPVALVTVAAITVVLIWTRRTDWKRTKQLWMTFLAVGSALGLVYHGGYVTGWPAWAQNALFLAYGVCFLLVGVFLWRGYRG